MAMGAGCGTVACAEGSADKCALPMEEVGGQGRGKQHTTQTVEQDGGTGGAMARGKSGGTVAAVELLAGVWKSPGCDGDTIRKERAVGGACGEGTRTARVGKGVFPFP